MIRALIVLLPLAASCYLRTEGGELPAGRLEVGQIRRDLLEVHGDGTFEVLSLYDARVCRGVLEPTERQRWRAIVGALREPWVRPPPEVVVLGGGSHCASLEPGGRSTGCSSDGGVRQQAADFAYELRARFDDAECDAVDGEPFLVTSWSVIPLIGRDLGISEFVEVEWRGGLARSRPIEEQDEWSACPTPTREQGAHLDALALAARDAMPLPRPDGWSLPNSPPDWGSFELSQIIWVSVFVESSYGYRGNRLVVDPDLYRDIGLALADVCGFATDEPGP